jgi:flagellar motor switch protein FliG
MDRTSPEVLREVERVLEKKLSTLSSEDYTAAGGVESIVEILNLVDRSSEKMIIEALEDEDPELAEEIKKRMFVFEDIVMLDDRAIQKVMREVDSQELAKALKSVDTEVQDKIFRNMSKRAAGMLKEDMEYMGPIRLKDVEEAQQKIVSIIRHLEDTGEIVVARSGEDELVV